MASRTARSRCVSGKSVVYLWAGESLGQTSEHASSRVIFELRWHFEAAAQHKGKTQIRHYEAEPVEVRNSVFGLVMHVKDITGTDTEITEKQNRQIEIAEILYDECSKNDWRLS